MRIVRALLRHETRLLVSLVLWAARRTHLAGGSGCVAFPYARGAGPLMFGLAFVCVIESLTMSVLLRDWPTVHRGVLGLDLYTVALVIGMHAADVVRPHVLDIGTGTLLIRRGAYVDLRVPLQQIAAVRRELRTAHERTASVLDLPVGARTTLVLELTHPVTHFTLLGRQRHIHTVRFHADDPASLTRAITQARTAPSTLPDRPAAA
ncbi:hypothetical protein DI272_34755 [Streptomyces sp. Act143]|uniref:hypothetical protein n=1 Tax=Streptomyces sp. Act143 TaxID=2200760 RepID=UPI000D683BC6|nr:hypothetical protein [Streptomyces sp. Act143]PWI18729.1 hypothetical protein DI272_34755 [Streptomyces sp. Act143]